MDSTMVPVLDHGYVVLHACLGDDLTPVNAARVSFDRRSQRNPDGSLKEQDVRLLRYLIRHGHWSPFRHAVLQFEVCAPLMVLRQWGKYRVGCTWVFQESDDPLETWNERSLRYVSGGISFYRPDHLRSAPENRKQGSGSPIRDEDNRRWLKRLENHYANALLLYEQAIQEGIAPEQARLFLPGFAVYQKAYWTVSLQGVLHFLEQRLQEDAQQEIQEYARAVLRLTEERFPVAVSLWKEFTGVSGA